MLGAIRAGMHKVVGWLPADVSQRFNALTFWQFAMIVGAILTLIFIVQSTVSTWKYERDVQKYNEKMQALETKIQDLDKQVLVREGILQEKDRHIQELVESIEMVNNVYEQLEKEAEQDEKSLQGSRQNYRSVRRGAVVPSRDDDDRARRLAELYPD